MERRSLRSRRVMAAGVLAVAVLTLLLAAPVRAVPLVTPGRPAVSAHPSPVVPVVIYTSTPSETTGRTAPLRAADGRTIPLVFYTSTPCDTARPTPDACAALLVVAAQRLPSAVR